MGGSLAVSSCLLDGHKDAGVNATEDCLIAEGCPQSGRQVGIILEHQGLGEGKAVVSTLGFQG
jgi:hypothetical protein